MANRSASTAALLVVAVAAAVFQATSAYVVPEGKLKSTTVLLDYLNPTYLNVIPPPV